MARLSRKQLAAIFAKMSGRERAKWGRSDAATFVRSIRKQVRGAGWNMRVVGGLKEKGAGRRKDLDLLLEPRRVDVTLHGLAEQLGWEGGYAEHGDNYTAKLPNGRYVDLWLDWDSPGGKRMDSHIRQQERVRLKRIKAEVQKRRKK